MEYSLKPPTISDPSFSKDLQIPQSQHISCSLPIFGASNPRLWFGQIEATFRIYNITDQTIMFSHVVRLLPLEIAEEVSELFHSMPEDDPYENLKSALIERVCISEQRIFDTLFSQMQLGDRKPSQLLRHMKELLRGMYESTSLIQAKFRTVKDCTWAEILSGCPSLDKYGG